jgi:lysophospholipase L1-like esterase
MTKRNIQSSDLPSSVVIATLTSGAPATGTWTAGQEILDVNGVIWTCTTGGAPGTWQRGSAFALAAMRPSVHAIAEADQMILANLTPTFTSESASSLTNPVTIAAASSNVLNASAPWVYSASDMAGYNGSRAVPLSPTQNGARSASYAYPTQLAFDFDGQAFEILLLETSSGGNLRVWANEVASAYQAIPTTGSTLYLKVDFGSRAPRRILIEIDYGPEFGGLVRNVTDSITAPTRFGALTAAVVGDSFGQGEAGDGTTHYSSRGYAWTLMRLLGITQWRDYSQGGTGFLNPNGTIGTYRTRISDVLGYQPNLVIIQGSNNDNTYTSAAIQTEIATYISALKAGLPASTVIAGLTPTLVDNSDITSTATTAAACLAAFQAAGIPYVDGYNAGWFYGTGNVTVATGDGNADYYHSGVGSHPTAAGYDFMGRNLATKLAPQIFRGL